MTYIRKNVSQRYREFRRATPEQKQQIAASDISVLSYYLRIGGAVADFRHLKNHRLAEYRMLIAQYGSDADRWDLRNDTSEQVRRAVFVHGNQLVQNAIFPGLVKSDSYVTLNAIVRTAHDVRHVARAKLRQK